MIKLFNIDDTQDYEFILSQMGKDVYINNSDEPTKVLITNTNLEQNYDDKKISSLLSLHRGDIVDVEDIRYMIISEVTSKRYNKYKAIMRQLPNKIVINCDCQFVNVDCYITSANLSVNSGNIISVATGEIQVHLSNIQYETVINLDHRFFVGNQVFKIVGIDDFSMDGVVTLTCKKDSVNPQWDDVENGIAGINFCEIEIDDDNTKQITINSNFSTPDEIKKNSSKEYYITDTTENVVWELFADDKVSVTTIALIAAQTGTSCTVKNNNATTGYVQLKATLISDSSVFDWYRIQMKPLY